MGRASLCFHGGRGHHITSSSTGNGNLISFAKFGLNRVNQTVVVLLAAGNENYQLLSAKLLCWQSLIQGVFWYCFLSKWLNTITEAATFLCSTSTGTWGVLGLGLLSKMGNFGLYTCVYGLCSDSKAIRLDKISTMECVVWNSFCYDIRYDVSRLI